MTLASIAVVLVAKSQSHPIDHGEGLSLDLIELLVKAPLYRKQEMLASRVFVHIKSARIDPSQRPPGEIPCVA